MAQLKCDSPLSWPEELVATPRVNQKTDHGFPAQLALADVIGYLQEELEDERFTAATLLLDTEQPLVERLRKKTGNKSGACLHLKHGGKQFVVACDRWQAMEHNIYALYLTVRHWRNMERWGVGSLLALMNGFEATRTRQAAKKQINITLPWMEAFGLGHTATLEDVTAIYHRRAKTIAHDTEALTQLNLLMDEARKHFSDHRA